MSAIMEGAARVSTYRVREESFICSSTGCFMAKEFSDFPTHPSAKRPLPVPAPTQSGGH